MAEPNGAPNDSGRDRATVALVDAKIDGLKALIQLEFSYIRERIEPITRIVAEQAQIKAQTEDHERRLQGLEKDKRKDREWRRVNLPSLIIAAVGAIGAITAVITQLH